MNNDQELTTRERILAVAARLFAERGYAGTSVRDIAAELGIANPSIYYHFKSKGDLLVELLTEPLKRVEVAALEAEQLSGEARARKIIGGLLESLEVHGGIVMTVAHDNQNIPSPHRQIALEMRPYLIDLLKEVTAEDNRELRITMAIGAVEGIVTDLTAVSAESGRFVQHLRNQREVIIDIVLGILR
ncbi:MAG: helix-turn-helix domain-containing protein [Chloroflexota bacterium]